MKVIENMITTTDVPPPEANTDLSTSGIYCMHGPKGLEFSNHGPLKGKKLAVKDLFHLKGERNAAGNPDWYKTHLPAEQTASSLQRLLDAGALFTGFTITDELAYSLSGNNVHYGSPDNPRLPHHSCGGSSTGSAAAVAADLADIGLGTDTGGSVRVPASYCGIYGFRPTHDAISTAGVIKLAASFDTVGWFCRNAQLLKKTGQLLLPPQPSQPPKQLVLCPEILQLAGSHLQTALDTFLHELSLHFSSTTTRSLKTGKMQDENILDLLPEAFRILQGREIIQQHSEWINHCNPKLTPDVQQRLYMAEKITNADVINAKHTQQLWTQQFTELLPDDNCVLLLPTTPGGAPLNHTSQTDDKDSENRNQLRRRTMNLTAIAGLVGAPQVHIPAFDIMEDGIRKPSGFSLLMRPGNDRRLLRLTSQLNLV